jgi:ubiquinone/menaquinone biosynthesis C-methylase UbiE
MAAPTAPTTGGYLLGAGESERARLIAQGETYRAATAALFDRLGLAPGSRALDVGCGPLGVLDLLAERAGPDGVVGLDREPRMLAMAQRSLAERGLSGVRLVPGDAARTGLPDGSFDLVHERLVLVNVPGPERVTAEMVRLVRPGGWVVLQDADVTTWGCEPPLPAWDRLRAAVYAAWQANGLDRHVGRRLAALLRGAGLVDVELEADLRVFRHGHPLQRQLLAFAQLFRERVLAAGGLSAAELDGLLDEVGAHFADPATHVVHFTLFRAWGRRPG